VDLGLTLFTTDLSMSPVDLAREAEARGLHSLHIPEHPPPPTSRRTPPPTGEEVLAEEYKRTLDPYVSLAGAASVTERIRLGTGIALVAQHDAIVLAKQLATLDVLSHGRLVLGIGYGWNREEMESHGIDVKRRRALVREKMLAMQALWSQEVAEFRGEFVHFEPSWQWPKPLQQPRPRTLIGGAAGPRLFAHVAEYADGWMPIGGLGSGSMEKLEAALAKRDRKVADLDLALFGAPTDPDQLRGRIEQGFDHLIFNLPPETADKTLPRLDRCAKLAEEVRAG
jgi:probable F420-dependent oxidoreductase